MVEKRNSKAPVRGNWKDWPEGFSARRFQDDVIDYRLFGTPDQRAATPHWPGQKRLADSGRLDNLSITMPADVFLHPGPSQQSRAQSGSAAGAVAEPQVVDRGAVDPVSTWLSCLGHNPVCARKKRYQKAAEDPELNRVTTFPNAAATVLDYVDTPRFLTGFSKETADWYEGMSSRLEKANFDIFANLKARKPVPGITDAEDGVDRGMVRFEQAQVQRELEALKRANPKLYAQVVKESNGTFERWKDANAAIGVSRRKLGRMPDFANEAERRRIGYETVRNEAAWSCARGRVCDARTLNGQ